jgi:hypothetical protein
MRTSLVNDAGAEIYESEDFPDLAWCPTTTWQTGQVIAVKTSVLYIGDVPGQGATDHITLALLPNNLTSSTMSGEADDLAFQIMHASGTVKALPGKNVLQIQTFTPSW